MEVILLGRDTCQEAAGDEATGTCGRLERLERWQRLATDHDGYAASLQGLWAEQARDR